METFEIIEFHNQYWIPAFWRQQLEIKYFVARFKPNHVIMVSNFEKFIIHLASYLILGQVAKFQDLPQKF